MKITRVTVIMMQSSFSLQGASLSFLPLPLSLSLLADKTDSLAFFFLKNKCLTTYLGSALSSLISLLKSVGQLVNGYSLYLPLFGKGLYHMLVSFALNCGDCLSFSVVVTGQVSVYVGCF